MRQRKHTSQDLQWVYDFFANLTEPFEKEIVKQLIHYEGNMADVYEEIHDKLAKLPPPPQIYPDKHAWTVLYAIIDTFIFYNPRTARDTRERCQNLKEVDKDIIKTIEQLIELLDYRDKLNARGGVYSEAYTNIFHLIKKAGSSIRLPVEKRYLFEKYVLPMIQSTGRFDSLRYYPTIKEFLEALIHEFEWSEVLPASPEDYAVLSSQKASQMDCIRFLLTRLEACKGISLSPEFDLSIESLKIIAECVTEVGLSEFAHTQISRIKNELKKLTIFA